MTILAINFLRTYYTCMYIYLRQSLFEYTFHIILFFFSDNSYYFKDVPYHWDNFNVPNGNCKRAGGQIKDYNNADEVRYCNLNGLDDLDFSRKDTTNHVVNYLNKLLSFGVAGFRIDAAKHMHPLEIQKIVNR